MCCKSLEEITGMKRKKNLALIIAVLLGAASVCNLTLWLFFFASLPSVRERLIRKNNSNKVKLLDFSIELSLKCHFHVRKGIFFPMGLLNKHKAIV